MSNRQKLKLMFNSTLGLLLAFAFFGLLQWILLLTGATVSAFHGQIQWNGFVFYITANHWNFNQVIALYLFSELIFILLFIFFPLRPKFPVKQPEILQMFFGWTGLFILVKSFFIPFWDIVHRKGLFFALSWSGFSRPLQYGVVITALLIFMVNIFTVSGVFSPLLQVSTNQPAKWKILSQVLFLWYLPFLILAGVIYLLSGSQILYPVNYLFAGIALAIMMNTPYIMSYKVIVK